MDAREERHPRRTKVLGVRLTDEEWEQLRWASFRTPGGMSSWCREVLLEAAEQAREEAKG